MISAIENAINEIEQFIHSSKEEELTYKISPEKWSKKEILGHLIDSAINNIRRFTEIQFTEKPYTINRYEQDLLVAANSYQQKEVSDIFNLWRELNKHIIYLFDLQTEETINYLIILSSTGETKTLGWLMEDYVFHLLHHVKQILNGDN